MKSTKILIASLLLLVPVHFLPAQQLTSFADLRKMVDEGLAQVNDDLYIEGYNVIIGDWGNVALNRPRYHNSVNPDNRHTAYIQNEDASLGFCIRGNSSKLYKKLKQGDRLTVNLKGTTVEKTPLGMYVISNLDQPNVLRTFAAGYEALPKKEKSIAEITDEDLCTYMAVKDCEFVFKDGAFVNYYETYGLSCGPTNASASPNGSMDGWASMLVDRSGNNIFVVCNTGCAWRRQGQGVPQGNGIVKGVVLADPMPRYSAFPVKYQVRSMNETYFRMNNPSAFKSIAEWNFNDGRTEFNTESGARKSLGAARVKADVGNGLLGVTVQGNVTRVDDYNNPKVEKSGVIGCRGDRGKVFYGALGISTPACSWWNWEKNEGNGIVVEFSTAGISGNLLMFAFTFAGGSINDRTADFPCYWKVQYSFDGTVYKDVEGGEHSCRSLPWWYERPIKGQMYTLSYECGLGLTDHMVLLPQECFGRDKVYVRVIPSRRNIATYAPTRSDRGALTRGLKRNSNVTFGSIAVRYE